ncbi:MAG TPA: glutamate--tRNA ligase family protein, partial [Thermoleophilia bacterium]|nr:glutamate--tRNA ligase family protein [Thermoleophilia bacterium]
DRDMGITHVIRGDDHLTNAARQQLLFEALGGPVPRWAHHSMVLGPDGGKLSKRHGATAVGEYRELGYLPEAIVNYLSLLGWSHGEDEVLDAERLVREFDLGRLSPSPAVFDLAKLDWLDHERIMALAPEEHERRFAERLLATTPPPAAAALAAAFQPSLVRYGDAPALAAEVLAPPPAPDELVAIARAAAPQLAHVRALRAEAPEWLTPAGARDLLAAYRAWGKEQGIGARQLLMPLRVALTHAEHGPELPFVLAALSRDAALQRLDRILAGNAAGESIPTPGDQP